MLLAACGDSVRPTTPQAQKPNDHPPSVTLEADRLTGEAAFDVTLQAHATDPDGNRLTYTWRANDKLIPDASGPTLRLTIHEAGQYEVTITVSDGEHQAQASVTITARDDYRPEDAPDVVIIGFAGRCGVFPLCLPPTDNRDYLSDAPSPNTLGAVARTFEQLGYSTAAFSFRSSLYDSPNGFGYQTADALLEYVRDHWIRDYRDPTRVVLVAHSHGNQFLSLLAWDHPAVRFDYAIYLDAVCYAWDGDHAQPLASVYGARSDYPAPLDTLPGACDTLHVPGVGLQDISDVVPWNVWWSLEVRSGGVIWSGMVADDDPNHRPDGTYGNAVGMASLYQPAEGHNAIHRDGSPALGWVLDLIALNGLPDMGVSPQARSAPLATPPAPSGYYLDR